MNRLRREYPRFTEVGVMYSHSASVDYSKQSTRDAFSAHVQGKPPPQVPQLDQSVA